jgi:undecaprenol kinase
MSRGANDPKAGGQDGPSPGPVKGHAFGQRLRWATQGIAAALKREKSMRTHLAALLAVVLVLAVCRATPMWWALMLMACALVLVTELLNTALEELADHLHPGQHPAIGRAKDMAAGAVLLASLCAVAVGVAWVISLW